MPSGTARAFQRVASQIGSLLFHKIIRQLGLSLACFVHERVLRVLPAPRSTQPSPRGRAVQLELRPSPPWGRGDRNGSLSLSEGEGEGRSSSRNARFER